MEQYFEHITESMSIEDVGILEVLDKEDCVVRVKAIPNSRLYRISNLSEARYRKVVSKLLSVKFVEAHTENREHSYFISEYGKEAIAKIFSKSAIK